MLKLKLENINKTFDGKNFVVKNFNLEVNNEDFVVLVGPSGCGKTTVLNIIAGLENQTSGNVYIEDKLVNNVDPKNRDIAMVFQNYALYPMLTVYDNLSFSLKIRKMKKPVIEQKVNEVAELLGISDLLKRKPRQLSGGQMQRVAIGRAIIRNPKVFLMDEPLSNLDVILRNKTRLEIKNLQENIKGTMIYVTHDQIEAMTMATKIVVMNQGEIQQVGTPYEIYNNPDNMFVAGFIGTPKINFIKCNVLNDEDGTYINLLKNKIYLKTLESISSDEVIVGIRPEDIIIDNTDEIFKVFNGDFTSNDTMTTKVFGVSEVYKWNWNYLIKLGPWQKVLFY